MYARNERTGGILSTNLEVADTFLRRLVGLMCRRSIATGEGLLIRPCSAVHTFFMRFRIDLVFVDSGNVVVSTASAVGPRRLVVGPKDAVMVLELKAGTVEATRTRPGDLLALC